MLNVDILRYINAPLLALIAGLGALVLIGTVLPSLRRRDVPAAARVGGRVLLGGAVLGVLALTLAFGSAASMGGNFVPGAGVAAELDNVNRGLAMANLAGNVALFVPLGVLAGPVLHWRPARVIASAALLSVAIEAAQLLSGRAADIDDVLLNTTGAAIGTLMTAVLVQAVQASRGRGRASVHRPETGEVVSPE